MRKRTYSVSVFVRAPAEYDETDVRALVNNCLQGGYSPERLEAEPCEVELEPEHPALTDEDRNPGMLP